MTKQKSIWLTAAIAGLLISSPVSNAADETKPVLGECHGANSCKGKGACAGKEVSCQGQNSCKGKGWVKLSKAQCDKKKGIFKKEVAKM